MEITLVLVHMWSEVAQALNELDICVHGAADVDCPVNLSPLVHAVQKRSMDADSVSSTAQASAMGCVEDGLSFKASVTHVLLGFSGPPLDVKPRDCRSWRVSIEVRSLRMTCTANVFVSYFHEAIRQPRPFRTPPVLTRRNAAVCVPHGFAAFTLVQTREDLQVQLEDFRAEIMQRDMYKKDSPIGFVETSLGAVFDRPLQFSPSLPSMVSGFRVLDQMLPILRADSHEKIGVLRLLFFLEDLGPGPDTARKGEVHGDGAVKETTEPFSRDSGTERSEHDAAPPQLDGAEGSHVATVRVTPHENTNLSSERERLEEDYRRREVARAQEFRLKQTELRDIEAKVRKKMQDLQQREVLIVAEEARLRSLKDDLQRRTDLAIQESEGVSKRQLMEMQHKVRVEQDRSHRLEEQVSEQREELALARQRVKDTEANCDKRLALCAPSAQLQQEYQSMQLELLEARRTASALQASRDHFRGKVEELCRRFLRAPNGGRDLDNAEGMRDTGPTHGRDMQTLQVIQSDLSQLAQDWQPPEDAGQRRSFRSPPETDESTSQHLEWLKSEKEDLLQSGLYTESDAVVLAINVKIAEVSRALGI